MFLLDAVRTSLTAYDAYKGNGFLVILSLVAILYLWILEDKKEIRLVLACIPFTLLVLFFFPVFSFVSSRYFLEGGVYYRLLWLVPFTLISSYSFVRVLSHLETQKKRLITVALFLFLIIQSGSLIYFNPLFKASENLYQLPSSVIEVADIMHVEGRSVKAVVPGEMLQFIRQYDPSINLAYGREELVEGWSDNPLYSYMESNPVKSYFITDEAKAQGVEYIILRTNTGIVGSNPIEKYEFTLIAQKSGYDIYIFDRADFAEAKKAEYIPLLDPDRQSFYINSATGFDSDYK